MALFLYFCSFDSYFSFTVFIFFFFFFFFSSRRRHTRYIGDWSSDVCSSDLRARPRVRAAGRRQDLRRQGGRLQVRLAPPSPVSWGRPPRSCGGCSRGRLRLCSALDVSHQNLFFEIGRASCRERVEMSGGGVG